MSTSGAIESPGFRSYAEWRLFVTIAMEGAANDNGHVWMPIRWWLNMPRGQ